MQNRKVTINMPSVKNVEFKRLCASLKRQLTHVLPEGTTTFVMLEQPNRMLQLTVKPNDVKVVVDEISVWGAKKPHLEIMVGDKLHRTKRITSVARPLKPAKSKPRPKKLPDSDFVDEESAGGTPKDLPDTDFVLEAAPRVRTNIADEEFVEEEEE